MNGRYTCGARFLCVAGALKERNGRLRRSFQCSPKEATMKNPGLIMAVVAATIALTALASAQTPAPSTTPLQAAPDASSPSTPDAAAEAAKAAQAEGTRKPPKPHRPPRTRRTRKPP